ncbi:AbrB family transcriptional regulator [Flavisphingomonas formosensis]|uniref:AbrB family transcriptional regulator n=1 Tax=Flavisphingomonas formosensis TaxID=861534 RepID=UPI0012FB077D|nr:AbrB family transcriptional regulator [Sphingomonas formosensis]
MAAEAAQPNDRRPTPVVRSQHGLSRLGVWQWPLLLAATILIAYLFHHWKVMSALFLGPLLAGLIFSFSHSDLKVSRKVPIGCQAVIGCLMARTIDLGIVRFVGGHWTAIAAVILATAVAACIVSWGLVRFTSLDAQTAALGSMPGAGNVMVTLAAEAGGDPRIVAFMQYVRLIVVLFTASLVASLLTGSGLHVAHGATPARPLPLHDTPLLDAVPTVVLAIVGLMLGRPSKIPAGPLLVTTVLGAIINVNGWFPIGLPYWTVTVAYGAVGWYVGLQFDRSMLSVALRNLPAMILAMLVLILLCAIAGLGLSLLLDVDLVTGYLATSPGAIDSIAILALNGQADMSVVMTVQTLRFFAVIMMAPYLVMLICRIIPKSPDTGASDASDNSRPSCTAP